MGTELLLAVVGPFLGATFGLTTFLYRRATTKVDSQLLSLGEKVEVVLDKVTDLRVTLGENYVSKEDLAILVQSKEQELSRTNKDIDQLKQAVTKIELKEDRIAEDLRKLGWEFGSSLGCMREENNKNRNDLY